MKARGNVQSLTRDVKGMRACRDRPSVTIIHTSDLHLGAEGAELEGSVRLNALRELVAAVRELNADFLIVAGDFFDHNRVDRGTVARVNEILDFLPDRTALVILPGNHDCYNSMSVFRRETIRRATILRDPIGERVEFGVHRLVVWGRPTVTHTPSFRPLAGAPIQVQPGWWYVAMAHGHLVRPDHPGDLMRASPISFDEIERLHCDYLALGHWDEQTQVPARGTETAWYSGSPVRRSRIASALLIRLGADGATVGPLRLDAALSPRRNC